MTGSSFRATCSSLMITAYWAGVLDPLVDVLNHSMNYSVANRDLRSPKIWWFLFRLRRVKRAERLGGAPTKMTNILSIPPQNTRNAQYIVHSVETTPAPPPTPLHGRPQPSPDPVRFRRYGCAPQLTPPARAQQIRQAQWWRKTPSARPSTFRRDPCRP